MATATTATEAELTKVVYKDGLQDLPFDHGYIGDDFAMKEDAKLGEKLQFDTVVSQEHGATYNGTGGAVVTLNDPIVANVKKAEISAYEFIMRTRIADRIMDDAKKGGPQSFESATRMVLTNLQESAELRKEQSLLYGQHGLFKVSSNTSGALIITDATWCAALAEALEGAVLEGFDALTATATQDNGDLTVSAVDFATKTITVTGTSTNVDSNTWLSFKGARTATAFNEMLGVYGLMTTVTGTVQGINIGTYSRMRPNVNTSFGSVNMLKVLNGIRKLVSRRIRKQKTKLWAPSHAYETLLSEMMAGRRFDGSYSKSKATSGAETIEFYSQTGTTTLAVHPLIRDGDMLAYGENNGFRTGSRDLSWDTGPEGKNDIWTRRQDQNAYEVRTRYVQAPGILKPAHVWAATGVTGG